MTMPKSTHARQNSRGKPVTGSIKRKLFFQIVAILLLSAALILFVNSRLLSQVYIWREKDNLQQAARSISEMDQTSDDFREQLSSLATKYNITAEIIDSAGRVVWATIYDPYYYSSRIPLLNSDVLLQFKHNLTTLEREPRDDGSYFEVREGRSHDIQYLVFGLPTDSGQTVEVFAQKNVIESNALLEYNLLRKLLASPGRVYTREQLLDSIWGIDYVGDIRTVDSHMARLRTKLGDWGGAHLKTVYGMGYKIEGHDA